MNSLLQNITAKVKSRAHEKHTTVPLFANQKCSQCKKLHPLASLCSFQEPALLVQLTIEVAHPTTGYIILVHNACNGSQHALLSIHDFV